MWPDRVSSPGPLTYESSALPTALRHPAMSIRATIGILHHENRHFSRGVHSGGSKSANSSNYNTPNTKSTLPDTKQQPMKMNLETKENQLLQLCTARTAWSDSDQARRAVHSCNGW